MCQLLCVCVFGGKCLIILLGCFSSTVTKKKVSAESSGLAAKIGDARDLLRCILAEAVSSSKFKVFLGELSCSQDFRDKREEILQECHSTFSACFHAFYPTGQLKWWCLCDLLCQTEPVCVKFCFTL